MKNLFLVLATLLITTTSYNTFAKEATQKETFRVSGNCESCKNRIEKAAKIDGVKKAFWDEKTKMLTVTFLASKVNIDQIQQSVAKSGHDTEKYKASDETYKNLPDCCHYDRDK